MDMLKQSELVADNSTRMSRRDKLLLWAGMIRASDRPLALYHLLERYTESQLKEARIAAHDQSAFGIAISSPAFQAAGLPTKASGILGSGPKTSSLHEVKGFFELSQGELHDFSCDCGGSISNDEMAKRIERIAG
jgi:hypothetical protein